MKLSDEILVQISLETCGLKEKLRLFYAFCRRDLIKEINSIKNIKDLNSKDEQQQIKTLNLFTKYQSYTYNVKFSSIEAAVQNGHMQVLNWWLNVGIQYDYVIENYYAEMLDKKVKIQDWRLNDYEYEQISWYLSHYVIQTQWTQVLDWWLKSGLQLKYTEDQLDVASEKGNIEVLDWWLKSGLYLKYTTASLDEASANGHVKVLDWWLKSGLQLKYTEDSLDIASEKGNIQVLDWWLKSGLQLKYTEKRKIEVLNWWVKSGLLV